jgi:hypothetical protein
MKHLKKFNEGQFNRIQQFLDEFKEYINFEEYGNEHTMVDKLSEVGDMCNRFNMSSDDLKFLIDDGHDEEEILSTLYDETLEKEIISKNKDEKLYTKEDVKQFGIFLGRNFRKNKNRSIDELFNEWIGK